MKTLKISKDLALPVDAATQTFLVVGKRGSGKSNTAARIVEQLLVAKVPVVIFDPVDSWYGLKASHGGRGQGHSVYVFGGRHKDVDLEPHAGALVAEFLCEHRTPLVLSCKHLSGIERSRFMVDFSMTLYRKWTGGVLHLVLEEAHELAPQNPPKGEKAEEMLGAFKKLWKLGRSSGIGGTAVTQRPASLSKDITTQSEILVVHRTIGPQDVEAVRQWIKYHHQGEEILPQLATLKTGEAFVWAPEFPEDKPIGLQRVQILPRDTFDSASTPKAGEQRSEPKDLAPVDLDRLRSKMAATIERAKAEDPKELRKQLAEARAQLVKAETFMRLQKPPAATATAKAPKTVERLVVREAQIKRLHELARRCEVAADRVFNAAGQLVTESRDIRDAISAARAPQTGEVRHEVATREGAGREAGAVMASRKIARPAPPPRAPARPPANGNGSLPRAERAILTAIAQRHPRTSTRAQVSILSGYSLRSSSFQNALSGLRTAAYIQGNGDVLGITATGLEALGDFPAMPSPEERHAWWNGKLQKAERALLDVIVREYPETVSRDALSERSGYSSTSSSFQNALSTLRTLELVEGRGDLVASRDLFE